MSSSLISALLVLGVSALLVVTGLRKQPGLGILVVLVVVALVLWLRTQPLASLGLRAQPSWWTTVLLALALGVLIQVLAVAAIEPLSEKLTGTPHDYSVLDHVRGNWRAFALWMLGVWVVVAPLEEGIYRGFLMTETAKVIGTGWGAAVANTLFSSLVFGLSHGYQGRSGILSTGIAGVFLGGVFILSGHNLWLAILTHGFIDTVGIALITVNGDTYIRRHIWRAEG